MSPIRETIIQQINAYCENFGVSTDALGRMSVGDPKIIGRLRRGQNVTLSRIEAMMAFIEQQYAAANDAREVEENESLARRV